MFDLLKARLKHGYQAIPDPTQVELPANYPGFPLLRETTPVIWEELEDICPSKAIDQHCIDLGKCVFCGTCERAYPEVVTFLPFHQTAVMDRQQLIVPVGLTAEEYQQRAVRAVPEVRRLFGRSLKLRSVSAGGCAACELELNACGNVNFDMGRYGIDIVASPRHADAVIVTGPVSANMAFALQETWAATPDQKLLILAGACAISGGVFAGSAALDRDWIQSLKPDLYIPGCAIHPLAVINGILAMLGRVRLC
jgi:Ni,Fe-hydrogenase III small subunit/ferredoxin